MFSLFLVFLTSGELKKIASIDLSHVYTASYRIAEDDTKNIWFADYWESKVYKLDPQGNILKDLAPKGRGPGEIFKPFGMEVVKEHLVVYLASGKMMLFDTKSGQYLKELKKRFPSARILKWDDATLLSFMGKRENSDKRIHTIGMDGIEQESWLESSWYADYLRKRRNHVSGVFSVAKDEKGNLYFADSFYPEVCKLQYLKGEPREWRVKIPKHFREKPSKPMPLSYRGNRAKMQQWHSSFTHLYGLEIIQGNYLAVCWEITDPHPFSLDLYDLATHDLVVQNFKVPGRLVASSGTELYIMEIKEPENDLEASDQLFLHAYKLER